MSPRSFGLAVSSGSSAKPTVASRSRNAPVFYVAVFALSLLWAPTLYSQTQQKPLSAENVIMLLYGGVSPKRIAVIAQQRGIDFELAGDTEKTLRRAGASDTLLETLRRIAPELPSALLVLSNPACASVYVDGQLQGVTSSSERNCDHFALESERAFENPPTKGELRISTLRPGSHDLQISMEYYTDYTRSLTLVAGQTETVAVSLLVGPKTGPLTVPDSVGAEITHGEELEAAGDLAGALASYTDVLQRHPNSSLAKFRMGCVFFRQRTYQQAANAYRAALNGDRDPQWTEVWSRIQLGKIFDITGQHSRALDEYRQAKEASTGRKP